MKKENSANTAVVHESKKSLGSKASRMTVWLMLIILIIVAGSAEVYSLHLRHNIKVIKASNPLANQPYTKTPNPKKYPPKLTTTG